MDRIALGDLHMGECTRQINDDVIAKPRNACTEHAWQAFLYALREAGLQDVPGCVEVLTETREQHTERRIRSRDTTPDGAADYYRRCGCLLCLTWLMGAFDLHAENLMAEGDMPVLVDLETLMSGVVARPAPFHKQSLCCSVTATHLLPHFDGERDLGGLTGDAGSNRPTIDGQPVRAQDFFSHLLNGFNAAFDFVLRHRESVCEALRRFDDCDFRVILRPTSTYQLMLHVLDEKPKEERWDAADGLLRIAYERDADPNRIHHAAQALKAETFALCHGWIPLFYVKGSGVALYCDGRQLDMERGEVRVMPDYLGVSPVDTASERIRSLSEADRVKQTAILRAVFRAKAPLEEAVPAADWRTRISNALNRDLIPDLPSGYMTLSMEDSRSVWCSVGWGLYEGAAGILCALAAMGEEKSPLFQRLYGQLDSALLQKGIETELTPEACALSKGVAGIIAGLIHIGELTGEAKYGKAAARLAEGMLPKVSGKPAYDVLTGLGGMCLQLPKLPRDQAARLAEAMLPVMRAAELPQTGAAHGRAGLALALGALQKTLNTNELDERILQLLLEENRYFDEEIGNWYDLRRSDRPGFMGGWCAGAPGIGMCRRRLLDYTRNDEIRALCETDIERVKRYLHCRGPLRRDTLCCGNAARLMAASCLGIELPEVRSILLRSADSTAPHLLHAVDTGDCNDTLMQGAAGVGYALATCGNRNSGAMLL